jgi:hypothetical protein
MAGQVLAFISRDLHWQGRDLASASFEMAGPEARPQSNVLCSDSGSDHALHAAPVK